MAKGTDLPKDTGLYIVGGNPMSVQKARREFAGVEKRMKAMYGLYS